MYIVCGEVFNTTGSWRSLLERTINFILKTPTVRGGVFYYFFSSVALYHLCKQVANITCQIRKPNNLSCQFVPLFQIAICYAEFLPTADSFNRPLPPFFFLLSQPIYISFVGSRQSWRQCLPVQRPAHPAILAISNKCRLVPMNFLVP